MILQRRDFLKLMGLTAGSAALGGCGAPWRVPDRLVELALRGPGLESEVESMCGLCEAGCGITVRLVDGLPVGLKGNTHHPINRGGLCPVGLAGLDLLYAPSRLVEPQRRGQAGSSQAVGWQVALDEVSRRLREVVAAGGGDRVVLLNGDPSTLMQDLAHRFAASMGSSEVVHTAAPDPLPYTLTQGLGRVPGFDLAGTDLVVSFGLDLYEDGHVPLYAMSALVGGRESGDRADLIHIGTRLSPTATKARFHVPILPDSHGVFSLGVAHVLVRENRHDAHFVARRTAGFEDALGRDGREPQGFRTLLLERYYPDRVAELCGCAPSDIFRVARHLAEAERPLAVVGGEAVRSSRATATTLCVHALNALLGAIDRPGGVRLPPEEPYSPLPPLTEASGEAMTERDPGDPVEELAERVLEGGEAVEVLLIVEADPVRDHPAGDRLAAAMEKIPCVVVLTPFANDTSASADWVLPTSLYLETWKVGTTPPTVPFSVLGLCHPVLSPIHDTRSAGDVLLEIARHSLGSEGWKPDWPTYQDYLKDRLQGLVDSGAGSIVTGSFEESWGHFLEERGWRFQPGEGVEEFWKELARKGAWWNPVGPQGDWRRMLATSSGRFEFPARLLEEQFRSPTGIGTDERVGASRSDDAVQERGLRELTLVPFRPITARGSWGSESPMVQEMSGYPVLLGWRVWAEVSPEVAAEAGLRDGDLVAVESRKAKIEAALRVRPGLGPGVVSMPLGLDPVPYGGGEERGVPLRPDELLSTVRDPLSGRLHRGPTKVTIRLIERAGGASPFAVQMGGHAS